MKLKTLLADLTVSEIVGNADLDVGGVHSDSRRIRKGDLFVAVRGEASDGHDFIEEAVSAGASAVVCERIAGEFPSAAQARVADARAALALVAARFHNRPSEAMKVVGITGTNGKTTTSYLIASIFQAAGLPTGIIGTIAYRIGQRELPAPNTTPAADALQELLAQMRQAGMKAVAMEVSSHALVQHRVDAVAWDAGVFTNLTQDHLDYHKDMAAYFEAKKLLFQRLGDGSKRAVAILNQDDRRTETLRKTVRSGVRVVTYGLSSSAEVRAESVEHSVAGSRFSVVTPEGRIEVATALCGEHNVSNSLAAAATAYALGVDPPTIRRGIELLKNVPGRLERVETPPTPSPFSIFVDYAHTHDALRNVLRTLRPLVGGRLITVFGCGGNRDKAKRPLMGKVASELSDFNILTTDNPRNEDPALIVRQIEEGFQPNRNYEVILDRREAIREALAAAKPGDAVLLAGKGHETYQETGGTRSAFDDRIVAREVWAEIAVKTPEAAWKS